MKPYPTRITLSRDSTLRLKKGLRTGLCTALLSASILPFARAQDEEATDEHVFVLSPFVVDASADSGYSVQNTISGSRLRMDLRDVAAPLSAFTEQFLDDGAFTNVEDLADVMLSTSYDLGQDAGSQNSFVADALQLRIRGLPGSSPSVNFFISPTRLDRFNLERVEQSRGPNSILFGISQPGGLINVTTKRANPGRTNFGSTTFQVMDPEGHRAELDYNLVLKRNQFAVRVALVTEETSTYRLTEFRDSDRAFFTTRGLFFGGKTDVNVELEVGQTDFSRRRTYTALDAYTLWNNGGRVISATPVPEAGVVQLSAPASGYLTVDTVTGQAINWAGGTVSARSISKTGENLPLNDESVLSREVSYAGDSYGAGMDYTRFTALVSHAFTNAINLELGYSRHSLDSYYVDVQEPDAQFLSVDTNPNLPDGQPNPNVGKYYFEGAPFTSTDNDVYEYFRSIGSWTLEPGGHWGRHTLAAVYQYSFIERRREQLREFVIENPFNPIVDNSRNRVRYRTYVDPEDSRNAQGLGDFRGVRPDGVTVIGSTPANSRSSIRTAFLPFSVNSSRWDDVERHSYTGMLQSYLLKNRLVTIFGVSRDDESALYSTQVRDPLEGFTTGPWREIWQDEPVKNSADNQSFGATFAATRWLILSYSRSQNSSIPPVSGTSASGAPPSPKGSSQNVGFRLDLLSGRLYLTATYFETTAEDDFGGNPNINRNNINAIWTTLENNGLLLGTPYQDSDLVRTNHNGDTFDAESTGFEVELTAQPTDNWRVYFNFSQLETKRTNLGTHTIAYIDRYRDFWSSFGDTPMHLPASYPGTVNDQIARLDAQIVDNFTLAEGEMPRGQSRYRGNMRTNYEFSEGPLENLSIGGAIAYRSAPVTAFSRGVAPDGSLFSEVRRGDEEFLINANIGYGGRMRVGRQNIRWNLQLNVNNVFNSRDQLIIRENAFGEILNYRYQAPRSFTLRLRLNF